MKQDDKAICILLGSLGLLAGGFILKAKLEKGEIVTIEKVPISKEMETIIREIQPYVITTNVEIIALDDARTNKVFYFSGKKIKVIELDGTATLRLNSTEEQLYTLKTGLEIAEDFRRFYLTNTAQVGKSLKIEIEGKIHSVNISNIQEIRDMLEDCGCCDCVDFEGDYTTWAIHDSFDDADADILADYGQYAVANRKETKIVLFDVKNDQIKDYDIVTKTVTDLGFTDPIMASACGENPPSRHSAYYTYFVVVDDYDAVKVIKDGVVIKTFTSAQLGIDATEIRTASISPKGKYIAVSGKRTATANAGWVILVGS